MKNKKGQIDVVVFLLMLGVTIMILGIALAPVLKEVIDISMNSSNMDCDNAGISKYTKMGCVVTDLSLFYFGMGLIILGGAVIAARKFI